MSSAMALTVALAVGLAWLSKSPSGKPGAPQKRGAVPKATPAGPGAKPGRTLHTHPEASPKRRYARLADELTAAEYRGPDPAEAYRSLRRHWRKMLDPYAQLPPHKAFLRVKVAFLTPDVATYLVPNARHRHRYLGRGDQKWAYTNGVYEAKLCLLAPFPGGNRPGTALPEGGQLTFPVALPERPVLDFSVGVIPRTSGVTWGARFAVDVEVDGRRHRVFQYTVDRNRFLTWIPQRVDLSRFGGKNVRLHLKTWGMEGAGLWADPAVFGTPGADGDNVLLLVVDTLRPDGVRALGGQHADTPRMDALVRKGTRMTRYYSNGSWTRASIVAFFSANYPSSVGLGTDTFVFPRGRRRGFYTKKPPQFPHHMDRQGYVTAGVVNNFFALPFASIGVDHGFPSFVDVRHRKLDNDAINRAAMAFLRRNRDRRFFLYVHYETAHDYDKNPGPLARQFPVPPGTPINVFFRAYLTLTRRIDGYIGRLIDALRELKLDKRTLVILTSDHGETFDVRHDHFVPHYAMKMRYQHARSAWDEVLHIPMVWVRPGRVPEGKTVRTQLRAIDMAPSILDYLGLKPMEPVAGRSYWPLIRKGSGRQSGAADDRPVYAEGFHIRALRAHGHKYLFRHSETRLYRYRGRTFVRPEELFDLSADPAETRNLSALKPEMTVQMRKLMASIVAQSRAGTKTNPLKSAGTVRQSVYHLRLCSNRTERELAGRLRMLDRRNRFTLKGATGRLSVKPTSDAMTTLKVELKAKAGCSGFDWSAPPSARTALDLRLDGKRLSPRKIFAGPYGLSVLKRNVLGPTESLVLQAGRAPVLPAKSQPGVFLWQDHSSGSGALMDQEVDARDKASSNLVKFNLIRGGYVKNKKP